MFGFINSSFRQTPGATSSFGDVQDLVRTIQNKIVQIFTLCIKICNYAESIGVKSIKPQNAPVHCILKIFHFMVYLRCLRWFRTIIWLMIWTAAFLHKWWFLFSIQNYNELTLISSYRYVLKDQISRICSIWNIHPLSPLKESLNYLWMVDLSKVFSIIPEKFLIRKSCLILIANETNSDFLELCPTTACGLHSHSIKPTSHFNTTTLTDFFHCPACHQSASENPSMQHSPPDWK